MTIEVDVPTIPERDELLKALQERGLAPEALDGADQIGVSIPCDDTESACDDVLAEVESWIAETGLPLVPVKGDGHVYIRPPGT